MIRLAHIVGASPTKFFLFEKSLQTRHSQSRTGKMIGLVVEYIVVMLS